MLDIKKIMVDKYFDPGCDCCGYDGAYGTQVKIIFNDGFNVKVFIKDRTSAKNAVSFGNFMVLLGDVITNNATTKDFVNSLNKGLTKIKCDYDAHIDYDDFYFDDDY